MPSEPKDLLFSEHWQLHRATLINWGVYEGGPFVVDFATSSVGSLTVIGGSTGVGKSQIIDAMLVLLMKSKVDLNRASEEAQKGDRKRDLFTYVRGYVGSRERDGRVAPRYLRGTDDAGRSQATWSFISLDLKSSLGATLCVAALIWVGAGEGASASPIWILSDEPLDGRRAESICNERFTRQRVRSIYPDARVVSDNKEDMRRAFHALTGTSERSEGLLYRNYSSGGGTNITSTFRDAVLEEPDTIEAANRLADAYDQAIESFRNAREQLMIGRELQRIESEYARYEELLRDDALYGSWGNERTDVSDRAEFERWYARKVIPLLDEEVGNAQAAHVSATEQLKDIEARLSDARKNRQSLETEFYQKGGDRVSSLEERLASAKAALTAREAARKSVESLFKKIEEEVPSSRQSWESRVALFLSDEDYQSSYRTKMGEFSDASTKKAAAEERVETARKELKTAELTRTRISPDMVAARDTLAKASDLSVDDMPFGCELMDLKEGEEQWRVAANYAFGRISDTIFIEGLSEREFRSRIEGTEAEEVGKRQRFRFVTFAGETLPTAREGMISSKLRFDTDSPFAVHVARAVMDRSVDMAFVETGEDFEEGVARQVSKKGQTKTGRDGAYGSSKRGPLDLIGFCDEAFLETLRTRLSDAETDLERQSSLSDSALNEAEGIKSEMTVAELARATTWDAIDVDGAKGLIESLEAQLREAREDPGLEDLEIRLNEARRKVEELSGQSGGVSKDVERAEEKLASLEEWRSEVVGYSQRRTDVLEASEELVDEFETHWDSCVGNQTHDLTVEKGAYEEARGRIERSLKNKARKTRAQLNSTRAGIEGQLLTFKTNYDNRLVELDGLDTTIKSCPFFLKIPHDGNWEEALAGNQAQAIKKLLGLLYDFANKIRRYEAGVNETIRRIGDVLSGYPYDREGGRLRLRPRFTNTGDYARVHQQTERLIVEQYGTYDTSDYRAMGGKERERILDEIGQVVSKIRGGQARRSNAYNDPRRRFQMTAQIEHGDGREPDVVDDFASSSGGEKEKTKAFITAAAMAYALGTPSNTLPRFAPIIFDEAFVKSDLSTTRLAVEALKGLGFQMIVSCPDHKLSSVYPIAERGCFVTRPEVGGPSFISQDEIADDQLAQFV